MSKPFDFNGSAIWITGASSGIGEELAKQAAAKGARLILSARDVSQLERVRSACIAAGANDVLVLPLDVSDFGAMQPAATTVLDHFGQIDLLVNNAGGTHRSFCVDTSMDVYRRMLDVNVLGQIALTKAVLPMMIAAGSGHVAVTSSVAGKLGSPLRTGYCAAKHAVMGFFDALRAEVADDGIAVTTILPGFVRTNIGDRALAGDGSAFRGDNSMIENGMPVEDCVHEIVAGLEAGTAEIIVAGEAELHALALKTNDPDQAMALLVQLGREARKAEPR